MAAELRQFEFFLVRYVPDPVKREFINIGVVVRAADSGSPGGETLVRFTRNWARVRCLDADADMTLLEELENDLRGRIAERIAEMRPFLEMAVGSLSNQVQLTRAEGCLAENLVTVAERQMRLYVEPRKREAVPRKGTRQTVYATMRSHFERAGVWDFMEKRIPVARYLDRADTLRIDCGYQNGRVRMFQALSLDELDPAKVLAFTAPGLARGVLRVAERELELTAIVEPLRRAGPEGEAEMGPERMALYDSGRRILEDAEVRFMTTNDLPRIAEAARRELGI